tara:strand:- start:2592 stop:2891 length:300 start_codon:yes stop_codon:yes gene_type:complete
MKIPKTFDHNQAAQAFWTWAMDNEPRHRTLKVNYLPIKGKLKKIHKGNDVSFWIRLLDFLVLKGWPEYVVIWTNNQEMVVFEKYLLQDVKNAIQRNRIR